MSDAPEKVEKEMLYELPVEQVLSFKGISKSVIESPDFIKMHLAHSIETRSNHSLILYADILHLRLADYDSFNLTNTAVFQKLDYPLQAGGLPSRFFGSCNGLICLLNPYEEIILLNPSTKKFKRLPVKLPDRKPEHAYSGIGYDSVNDDYKVVRILQYSDADNDKEIMVYSLKSNSWKLRVLDFPHFITVGNGVLANGALHWVLDRKMVAAVDLGTEEFRLVTNLPEISDDKFSLDLGVLDECLCVFCKYEVDEHAEIWIRKKNWPEVDHNWTILISIRQTDLDEGFVHMKPIAYSKCGKRVLLFQDGSKLLWYDLEEKSTSYAIMQFGCGLPSFQLDIYVHSLVQPNSGSRNTGEVKREEQDSNKKQKRDDFLSTGFKLKL